MIINQIVHGDCLDILRAMPDEQVHLAYLDPPFFTQASHALKSRDLIEYRFDDTWESITAYIEFLRPRIAEVRRVMRADATIFVHCDRRASHYIRVLLDALFGYERFLSEIIWTYRRWSNASRSLLPSHQTIFMYSKSAQYAFNDLRQPYSEATNLDQILQKRERNAVGKATYATDAHGEVILNGPKKGVPLSDTWDIPYLNPKAAERTGYPTQKPLLLLERIIQLASQPGDMILDPFCGSGTTCVAALLLERAYLGIDSSADAVQLARNRLTSPVRSASPLLKKGREAYRNLPEAVADLLRLLPVKLVQRNSGIDAIHDRFVDGRPVVLRVQRPGEPLCEAAEKLYRAGRRKDASLMLLIRTEQMAVQTAFLDTDEGIPAAITVIDSPALSLQQQIDALVETS